MNLNLNMTNTEQIIPICGLSLYFFQSSYAVDKDSEYHLPDCIDFLSFSL